LATPSDLIVSATVAAGVLAAAAIDLRTRRVPNALTLSLAVTGLAFAAVGVGRLTLAGSLLGLGVGLALMLPGHLFGATGAGDVKLFAAIGALIGPASIATAFLYTAIAGGCLAAAVAVRRRRLGATLDRARRLVASGGATSDEIERVGAANRFAYAPAIAIGVLMAAIAR
jgi:prepilin peptidase CpaA